jgi:hypothetical protein
VDRVGQRSQRRLDVVPTLLVVEASSDELGDEGTASAGADTPIELSDELVIKGYVHAYGPRIAH